MKPLRVFDVFDCDLDGVNLIEASAGTGKTWSICGLYLRLLLERGLKVQGILVVTFTNAATAELRERVRARIVETLAYLRGGEDRDAPGDPFVARLVQAVEQRTGIAREQMALTLDEALQFFDEAAIFTIHGFCQRALGDVAFSAGMPFSLELVTDVGEMTLEAVHDFWRRRVAGDDCPRILAAHLLERKDSPEKYAQLLARSLAKPLAKCLWPASSAGTELDTAELEAGYAAARRTWATQRDEILATIRAGLPALNRRSYSDEAIDTAAAGWDEWFRQDSALPCPPGRSKLALLSSGMLATCTKQDKITPRQVFFEQAQTLLSECDAMTRAVGLLRMCLIRELLETVGPDLRRRRRERRVIGFDDMLYNLYAALAADHGDGLASSLRERFPAALIDEFQDTDPLQFAIFTRVYGSGGAPAFLVGDPKQAIYSFRNADLHAYLGARRHALAEYTLGDNQRSTASLLAALNGLFAANPRAFLLEGLDYHPVAMGEKERTAFVDNSSPRAPLQVWMLPPAPDGTALRKQAARRASVQATAAEIARLLAEGGSGRIRIGDRALAPGDIAVLVRTHAQGSEMKRELSALGIASVELSQASVFQSPDAEEVERVLLAIQQPSRDTLLRGALATEMLGLDAAQIAAISADEARMIEYHERFAGYRDLWLRHGVGVMFRRLLTDHQVSARMLRRPDGERRLTNLLHLGELIHAAAATHESPDALLRWLQAQRRDDAADEIAQLRLESDRNLVQIVTIHKAKGLEFPIVFCPFLWDGRRFGGPKPEGCEYHDDEGAAVIDFRTDDELGDEAAAIKAQIRLEESAEMLRLIYVALTRAVYRCYLFAGTYATGNSRSLSTVESTKSLLNWLVAGAGETPDAWLDAKNRQPAAIADAWRAFAARLSPHVRLDPLPSGAGAPVTLPGPKPESLEALPPPRSIPPAWRTGSFSGFVGEARSESAADDHDTQVGDVAWRIGSPPAAIAPDDILRFPQGAGAGECLHAILECVDFTDPAGWDRAIARGLFAHPQSVPGGRDSEPSPTLVRMIDGMLSALAHTALSEGLVLGKVPRARCRTELEFSLPAPGVSAHALAATLGRAGYELPHLWFGELEGYLRGFIDLVFEHGGRYYVIDWKSNHLGYSPADYGPARLRAAMADHGYHLQYLLYALAVDRYLRHRLPGYRYDTHFGGVLYLFVRGVRPGWVNADGSPAGVYFHRPARATLAQLDALFAPTQALSKVAP